MFEAHPNSIQHKPLCALVPGAGFEPARSYDQRILSPQRLPFRHPGEEGQQAPSGWIFTDSEASENSEDGFRRRHNVSEKLFGYRSSGFVQKMP